MDQEKKELIETGLAYIEGALFVLTAHPFIKPVGDKFSYDEESHKRVFLHLMLESGLSVSLDSGESDSSDEDMTE